MGDNLYVGFANQVLFMKFVSLLTLLFFLYGCADFSSAPIKKQIWCNPPRLKICTMEYQPVCGNLSSGMKKDFSSPCNACAEDQVASYSLGPCQEENK